MDLIFDSLPHGCRFNKSGIHCAFCGRLMDLIFYTFLCLCVCVCRRFKQERSVNFSTPFLRRVKVRVWGKII